MFKAFDPHLQRWFTAPTKGELASLLNHPQFVALRKARIERAERDQQAHEQHAINQVLEAAAKRDRKAARRLAHRINQAA